MRGFSAVQSTLWACKKCRPKVRHRSGTSADCLRITVIMAHGDCRMYEAKFPEVDDVVMVQVKSIAEMGAYVSLLEYNNIEGMILLSELSRRRIRSITKLIKVCATCYPPPPFRPPPPSCACAVAVHNRHASITWASATHTRSAWHCLAACTPCMLSIALRACIGRSTQPSTVPHQPCVTLVSATAGRQTGAGHGASCGQGEGLH